MPTPTPWLLFRSTTPFARFKIHQPLPMSSREAKQLLTLLTSSFRRQLDREHGPRRPSHQSASSHSTESKESMHSQAVESEKRLPTDRHLHAILTNPLFRHVPERLLGGAQNSKRDPMEVFDDACAQGLMNIPRARAILYGKKSLIISSSVPSVRDGMQSSGAGKRVLKWLISSGVANNVEFLQDKEFAKVLIEYLVAEELTEVIWSWITRADVEGAKEKSKKTLVSYLLFDLITAEASGFVSLDAAYASFTRAQALIANWKAESRPILARIGNWLSTESTRASSYRPSASPDSFDSFLESVPSFVTWSVAQKFQLAHLHLHHPTRPSAAPALKFLRGVRRELLRNPTRTDKAALTHEYLYYTSRHKSRIITIGLEAAKLLLESDAAKEAQWAMDFLQEFYTREVGADQDDRTSQAEALARAEAASLQLLEGLDGA